MPAIDIIPFEIWSEILFLATRPLSPCYPLPSTNHKPFDLNPTDNLIGQVSTLGTRANITLVSHKWNVLGTPYLYEFLRLSRSAAFEGLLTALKRDDGGGQVARYVRSVVLPYEHHPSSSPIPILTLLQNLEAIIRDPTPAYHWPVPTHDLNPPLPLPLAPISPVLGNIKRIDYFEHRYAARIGGLSSLPALLNVCSSVECLSISGDRCESPEIVVLPSLTTLRLERFITTERLCKYWTMDNLQHVIVNINLYYTRLSQFWQRFGENLHTVELAVTKGSFPRPGKELSDILEMCPNLKELGYHIEFSSAPIFRNGAHTSLTRLKLHAGYPRCSIMTEEQLFSHVLAHFDVFSEGTVPCLEEVMLCGVWTDTKPVQGIQGVLQEFRTRYKGARVEREGLKIHTTT